MSANGSITKRKKTMEIICQKRLEYTKYLSINFNGELTSHFSDDRKERHNNIVSHIGEGTYICTFLCDTNHPNGNELHSIFDNGIILVQNERTKKIVTELIARPNQIRRYWTIDNKNFPAKYEYILNKCRIHEQKRYNQDYWD